jgi:hypothetical protein
LQAEDHNREQDRLQNSTTVGKQGDSTVNRRSFVRSLGALPLGVGTSTTAAAELEVRIKPESLITATTFTAVGKEEQPFLDRAEADLASQTGAGYLDHMWFGGDFANYLKLRIRLYIDHEHTSSIDMEIGMGAGIGYEDATAPWGTAFSGVTGSPSGIFLNYRIPFRSHIRITAELPSGVARTTVFWWILRGVLNLPLQVGDMCLPGASRLRLHRIEDLRVEPLDEFSLCSIEGSGMIFQVAMAAKSANYHYIEGQMRAYIGGVHEPQMLSSGLEDYFLGTYGFNRGLYHLPQAGCTHRVDSDNSFSGYRFHVIDPIFFKNGLRLACRCGEKRGSKPFGVPVTTTFTAYVWTYEW